jgi:hypothetical protein
VGQLDLRLTSAGASQLAVYGSNDPRPQTFPEGWTRLSGPKVAEETAKFDLEGSYQYLLVWFTSLPQEEGKFRGRIAEAVVRS